jgi:peptidoglycan/xylan/chitin deacetylase (PgdA/CDA1 family)
MSQTDPSTGPSGAAGPTPSRSTTGAPDPSPARRALKTGAELWDRVRRPRPGVVILIYHRVGRRSSIEVDLPTSLFEEQMAHLAATGRVATLDDALARLVAPVPPDADRTPDPVVVTFDDGTADLAEVATPILERHGVPALLYLATDFVDRGHAFPDDGQPLSWNAMRELVDSGCWQIGSHTHTHALLDRLAPDEIDAELDRSIERVATETGSAPRHFAYPKALAPSVAAERAVRRRFRSAALAGTRPNEYGVTDPWRLARSPVQVSDGMRWFVRKLDGGMAAEDSIRRAVNRRRYAGARS